MSHFSEILMFWRKIARKCDAIKNDPQEAENSTKLGTKSLIGSIVGFILTVGFAALAYFCYLGTQTSLIIFAFIGAFLFGFFAILCFVELVLAGVVYAFYQLKLNKRLIGKVAMVVSLLISITTIVVVIIVLNYFPAIT